MTQLMSERGDGRRHGGLKCLACFVRVSSALDVQPKYYQSPTGFLPIIAAGCRGYLFCQLNTRCLVVV
jgi:hypothetical protein